MAKGSLNIPDAIGTVNYGLLNENGAVQPRFYVSLITPSFFTSARRECTIS